MTLSLIKDRAPPYLDLGALVTSELASTDKGATTQCSRWEHGSINMAMKAAPSLFMRGLKGDLRSLAAALDICVPPLTVLAAMLAAMLMASFAAALFGATAPLKLTLTSIFLFVASVGVAWAAYGRAILPPRTLAAIGAYIAGKARVYGSEGRRSAERWTRTDRGDGA